MRTFLTKFRPAFAWLYTILSMLQLEVVSSGQRNVNGLRLRRV